jgi:hypothetical protein
MLNRLTYPFPHFYIVFYVGWTLIRFSSLFPHISCFMCDQCWTGWPTPSLISILCFMCDQCWTGWPITSLISCVLCVINVERWHITSLISCILCVINVEPRNEGRDRSTGSTLITHKTQEMREGIGQPVQHWSHIKHNIEMREGMDQPFQHWSHSMLNRLTYPFPHFYIVFYV